MSPFGKLRFIPLFLCLFLAGCASTDHSFLRLGSLPQLQQVAVAPETPLPAQQTMVNPYQDLCPATVYVGSSDRAFSSILLSTGKGFISMPYPDGSDWWSFELAHECAHLVLKHPNLRFAGLVFTADDYRQQELDADRLACQILKQRNLTRIVIQGGIGFFSTHNLSISSDHPSSALRVQRLKECLAG